MTITTHPRRALLCAATCAFLLVCVLCGAQTAHADGGVTALGLIFRTENLNEVSPQPMQERNPSSIDATTGEEIDASDAPPSSPLDAFGAVSFDKNVAMPNGGSDDSFVQSNVEKIHLRKAGSSQYIDFEPFAYSIDRDSRRLIYFRTVDWLDPLTTYEIVVEPGIMAANGSDESVEEYVFTFRTSALLRNGLMLYDMIAIIGAVIVFACGVVFAVRRARKRRA